MKKHIITYTTLTLLAMGSFLNAQETERKLVYHIEMSGQQAGQLSILDNYEDLKLIKTKSVVEIDLTPLGEDFNVFINSEVSWANERPTGFDHFIISNEERWHLKGETKGGDYILSAAQVRTPEQEENAELLGLAGFVAANTIPYADAALTIAGLFSSQESEGEWAIPHKSLPLTDLELVEHVMSLPEWKGSKKIQVFMTESLEDQKIKIKCLTDETVTVPAGTFECRVFEVKSKSGVATYWITKHEKMGVFPVKENGKEDGIDYNVSLQSVAKTT